MNLHHEDTREWTGEQTGALDLLRGVLFPQLK